MQENVNEIAAQMSAMQTVLWFFASVFGSLALRAFVATQGRKIGTFQVKTFYSENVVRLWLGLAIVVFFSGLMFSPEASAAIEGYVPLKVSPVTPVAFGVATSFFLLSGFTARKPQKEDEENETDSSANPV